MARKRRLSGGPDQERVQYPLEFCCVFLNSLPGMLNVPLFRVGLPDAHSQSKFSVEFCVRQVEVAAAIQAIH